MIVHLTGGKWLNTERICSVSKETRKRTSELKHADGDVLESITEDIIVYVITFDSTRMTLSQTQGEELLSVLPMPYDAEGRRKRKQAEATLVGQLGRVRWESMDDDELYDAVSDEAERMQTMQAQEQTHGRAIDTSTGRRTIR